jgi:hypothetical protein
MNNGQYPLGLYLELLSDPTRQLTIVNSDQTSDITNMAMVAANNPETDSSNNESSITTAVTTQADVSLTMNARRAEARHHPSQPAPLKI